MKIKIIVSIIIVCILCISTNLYAQTLEDYKKQQNKGLNAMQTKMQADIKKIKDQINQYIKEKDKEFSDYLKTQWEKYNLYDGKKPTEKPKPDSIPVFKPDETINIDFLLPEPVIKEDNQNNNLSIVKQNIDIPVLSKEEPLSFEKYNVQLAFYGKNLNFDYDKKLIVDIPEIIDETTIAAYWEKMAETNYNHLIDQLLIEKSNLKLNDFGYYLLIRNLSNKIYTSNANLLSWVLLIRSGYKARIGYEENNAIILLPSENNLWQRPYYTFDNINYYLFDSKYVSIRTYKKDFPDCNKLFDFNIYEPINIGNQTIQKNVENNNDDIVSNITISIKPENINFYKDYPLSDVNVFYNAPVSIETRASLKHSLSPMIEGKTEEDALNFLLNFVQKSFRYQTDEDQFGAEKFFFPEEMFFYPYSDCDDRVSLFTYLVRDLLNIDVVALEYPGHIASAIKTKTNISGDYIMYKNNKYLIADPTYIGAPIGECMPKFKNVSPAVIELNNIYATEKNEHQILENITKNGGIADSYQCFIDESNNLFVTGSYKNELQISDKILNSLNQNQFGSFVAKFDINNKLIWLIPIISNDIPNSIYIFVQKNRCYIASNFKNEVKISEQMIKNENSSNVYLACINETGNVLWTNKVFQENKNLETKTLLIAKLSYKGDVVWTNFKGKDNNKDMGITMDTDNNIYLSILSY